MMKNQFYNYIENLQDQITSTFEDIDGKAKFKEDLWQRKEGGGGRTRVIQNGNVLKKVVLIFLKSMAHFLQPCKPILMLEMLIFLLVV